MVLGIDANGELLHLNKKPIHNEEIAPAIRHIYVDGQRNELHHVPQGGQGTAVRQVLDHDGHGLPQRNEGFVAMISDQGNRTPSRRDSWRHEGAGAGRGPSNVYDSEAVAAAAPTNDTLSNEPNVTPMIDVCSCC